MDTAPPPLEATADDLRHLQLLSVFHYVMGGVTGLFALFPVLHLVMGLAIVSGRLPMEDAGAAPFDPRMVGWIFVVAASLMIAFGLALAGLMVYAGRCIARRRRHLLCLVVAALSCMMMPVGTVLGVFTLMVLTRPRVRALFPES